MAKRSSSSAEQGIACQRALAPCNIQFAAIMHTSICSGSKYKGKEKKKTQPVNNNINCHQWSEQCYKSFLNHRMSMLWKFPFSLKPYVTGRDRGPIGSSCCCTGEAWAGLFLLPSAPHILTAQQPIQKCWHCWASLQQRSLALEEEENERRQWIERCFQRNLCDLGTALTDHI